MGAKPYWYFVSYERDASTALQKLREREFKAGRYNPVVRGVSFPLGDSPPSPGPGHTSIDEALESSGEEGTHSILDMAQVGGDSALMTAWLVPDDEIELIYGTARPTREMLEDLRLLELIDRGEGVCTIAYKDGRPDEWFFAGYSFD